MKTVKDVARLAGLTVRALHHYDAIGLMRPSGRSDSGYRLYSHDDLLRLQEIVAWQQLGFPLREIQVLLDDPAHDRVEALRRQRTLADEQRARFRAMVIALDKAIAAHDEGRRLKEETMFEGFDAGAYADEAETRWGGTVQYKESERRVARYRDEDWQLIKAEASEIEDGFVGFLVDHTDPTEPAVMDLAEQHRQHITRWFYDCSREVHRGLGEMFAADPRFRETWETRHAGLADFVRQAFVANSERDGSDPPALGSARRR